MTLYCDRFLICHNTDTGLLICAFIHKQNLKSRRALPVWCHRATARRFMLHVLNSPNDSHIILRTQKIILLLLMRKANDKIVF